MASRKGAILITVTGGEVDYVSTGDPTVVLIDWDDLRDDNVDDFMVIDIVDRINEVKKLPADMPWRQATIERLEKYRDKVEASPHKMAL